MTKTIAQILVMVLLLAVVCAAIPTAAAEQSTVIYTMDEGSRPASYGCTARTGIASFADNGEGNTELKYLYRNSSGSIQDQSCYFKLPADIYTKYGTPTKLTFRAYADATIIFNKKIYMSSTATNVLGTAASDNWTGWSFNATQRTVEIDFTKGAGLTALQNGYTYLNFRNQSGTQSGTYFCIDDVTLYYEGGETPPETEPATTVPTTPRFNITLDGTSTEYEQGATYTFPESSDSSFIAYTDGTDYYRPGATFTVNAARTFTSFSLGLRMVKGASMRYNVKTGMRFYTTCNPAALVTLYNAGAFTGAGRLIAPVNLLGNNNLTKDIDESIFADCQYKATELYTEGSFSGVVSSLVDIKLGNVNREFVGRGYVDINFNGIKKTLYASYADDSIANNSRTICYIAKEIFDSDEYATLDANKKAIVDYYNGLYE